MTNSRKNVSDEKMVNPRKHMIDSKKTMPASKKHKKIWIIIIPVFLLVVAAGVALFIYDGKKEEIEWKRQKQVIDSAKNGNSEAGNLLAAAQKINPDTVAWIEIPDTNVDFPIVQGEDNSYYLNHNFQNEDSYIGVPFLDCRNLADFQDYTSIVYGHHISGGLMFSALDKFKNQDYLKQHDLGTLTLPDRKQQVVFVACLVADSMGDVYDTVILSKADRENYVKYIEDTAVAVTRENLSFLTEEKLLILSTCSYEYNGARTVLVGYFK
jgi:sortase B